MSSRFGSLVVGFYAWIVAAACGAVLLDVVYANGIRAALEPSQAARLFNEPADFIGLLSGVSVVAGMAALVAAWHTRARNFLIASALIVVGTPLIALVIGPMLVETQAGPWLRIALSGAASVLGLLGLRNVYRRA